MDGSVFFRHRNLATAKSSDIHENQTKMSNPNTPLEPPRKLGRLCRMRALKPSDIPRHGDLGPALQNTGRRTPDLQAFIAEALEEANAFMTGYLPRNFDVKSNAKPSPPSTAPVELLSREVKSGEINAVAANIPAGRTAETWFARSSIHENAAKDGTMSWEEFDSGTRSDHSLHEAEYTPDVIDAHQVLSWDDQLEEQCQRIIGTWQDVGMAIFEMVHHIPPPLNDRVFNVIVLTAKHGSGNESLVVQIPVETGGMPRAKYSGGKGNVTEGMYTSIERGELLDDGAKLKWQMATASDAKGVLPMWAQKMGVPGAVVKDVGLFVKWCAERRAGQA